MESSLVNARNAQMAATANAETPVTPTKEAAGPGLADAEKRKRDEEVSKSPIQASPTRKKAMVNEEPLVDKKDTKDPVLVTSSFSQFAGKKGAATASWDDFAEDDEEDLPNKKTPAKDSSAAAASSKKPSSASSVRLGFGSSSTSTLGQSSFSSSSGMGSAPGIRQSNLGTFGGPVTTGHSPAAKPQSTYTSTFGTAFQGHTFGASSAAKSGFSFGSTTGLAPKEGSESQKNAFSELLMSPDKKRIRVFKNEELDKQGDEEEEDANSSEKGFVLGQESWKLPEGKEMIQLLDQGALKTGEEEETTHFSARCKLYAWDKEKKTESWRERGIGNVKVNVANTRAGRARLVMRAEGVLKVILNVQIVAGMPAKLRDDKYIEIIACEKPPAFTKFLFKLGNKENAKAFFDSILLVMPKEEETKGAEVKADASKAEASTGEETVDSVETASEPGFSQTQNLDSGEEDRPEDEPEVKESPKKE